MIKLIKSTFYNEEDTKKKLADFIISSKHLSFGKECEQFEKNLALYQGRKYSIFFNSGSSANFALIQSLKNLCRLTGGDKIAFSSVTWSTNVMPIIQMCMEPFPLDVELDTLNVSSRILFQAPLSIKAIFLTNLLGFCDDIDKIAEICKQKNIILLEDNCESIGSVYSGKKLGNFGLASTFSFYVGHHMSTIEGGAVCTDDRELATMLRIVRAHGWDRNLDSKGQKEIRRKHKINSPFYGLYSFYDLGNNFRPTEINGFLGNVQLGYLNEIVKKRSRNFLDFVKVFNNNSNLFYPIRYDHMDTFSNFAFPVICRSEKIKNKLLDKCNNFLEVRPIVGGSMIEQPYYKKYFSGDLKTYNMKNAEIIHKQGFYFGNNPELTESEKNKIIELFSNLEKSL